MRRGAAEHRGVSVIGQAVKTGQLVLTFGRPRSIRGVGLVGQC